MKPFNTLIIICISIVFPFISQAQTIATSPLQASQFCAGTQLDVSFMASSGFNTDNYFIAQLSDPSGNFTTFKNIGNLKSTTSGTIVASLPADLKEGSNYRIRVISSNPYIAGSDNGSNIAIYNPPKNGLSIGTNKYFHLVNEDIQFSLGYDSKYYGSPEWNFGSDATPQTYSGFNPPPVRYGSTGKKNITCRTQPLVTSCSYSTNVSTSIEIHGYCEVKIDSTAFVDSVKIDNSNHDLYDSLLFKYYKQIWILPCGSITMQQSVGDNVYIIETGGSLTIVEAYNSIFYLKPGASLTIYGWYMANCVIFRSPGTSVVLPPDSMVQGHNNLIYNCSSIQYHYKTAPKGGVEWMVQHGYLDVRDNRSIQQSEISIYPNPASDRITIDLGQFSHGLTSIEIIDVLCNVVINKSISQIGDSNHLAIDISNLSIGTYTCILKSSNMIKAERIIVSR